MQLKYHHPDSEFSIAELCEENFIINQPQHVLDIFGNLMFTNCDRLIIHEDNLHADFFDLKTRLAGEVLQKFSNYRVKLVIVGDFAKYKSKSLQEFIIESNKSNTVFFTENLSSALKRLEK